MSELNLSPYEAAKKDKEKLLQEKLQVHLERLRSVGWLWFPEVWIDCFIGAEARRLRIDYVVELDKVIFGIELKRSASRIAELGQQIRQCHQYAMGNISKQNRNEIPRHWLGASLFSVFLATTDLRSTYRIYTNALPEEAWDYYLARFMGAFNVGVLVRKKRRGITLELCDDRLWSEDLGWHQGSIANKKIRMGNSAVKKP